MVHQWLILDVLQRARQKDSSRQVPGDWLCYSFYPLSPSCRGQGDDRSTLNIVSSYGYVSSNAVLFSITKWLVSSQRKKRVKSAWGRPLELWS